MNRQRKVLITITYNEMGIITDTKAEEVAQPQRPKGEWITKTVKKFCAPDCWYPGIFAIEDSWNEEEGSWLEEQEGFCSECGKQDELHNIHNYCPYCGADMRGTENE